MKRELKIATVGSGISGCTAYLQLQNHLPGNHDITIYEKLTIQTKTPHTQIGKMAQHTRPLWSWAAVLASARTACTFFSA
jgi:glycine/D-amino acid oxidase-like deaminating enzyme